MKEILRDFQAMEERRVNKLKDVMDMIVTAQQNLLTEYAKQEEEFKDAASKINGLEDIQNFISINKTGLQPPKPTEYEPYKGKHEQFKRRVFLLQLQLKQEMNQQPLLQLPNQRPEAQKRLPETLLRHLLKQKLFMSIMQLMQQNLVSLLGILLMLQNKMHLVGGKEKIRASTVCFPVIMLNLLLVVLPLLLEMVKNVVWRNLNLLLLLLTN